MPTPTPTPATPDAPAPADAAYDVDTAADAIGALLDPTASPDGTPQPRDAQGRYAAPPAAESDAPAEATAEDADAAEQPPTEEAPVTPAAPTIRLEDGTEWTAEDVKKGTLRQADYTRKTQELADQRRAFQAEAEATRQERALYADRLGQLEALLTSQGPSTAGLDELRQSNPAEYAARLADLTRYQQQVATVQLERQRVEQQQAADREAAFRATVAKEREALLSAFPEWQADPTKAQAEVTAMRGAAAQYGFTDAELDQVVDHRTLLVLHDAMQWRAHVAARAKVKPKIAAAPVLAPGAAPTPAARAGADVRKAMQRAQQSGRLEDAAAAIGALLDS